MGIETLALATLAPSLLLLAYFRSRDAYPEPARVIWTTFVLGILIALPVLAFAIPLGDLLGADADPLLRGSYDAFVLAALPEEACKLLVLLLYVRTHSAFDEPMDGLVYGVAASLGFATLENVLYVADGGLQVALLRSITAVPAHATLGAIMGYYVGQAHFTPSRARALLWRAWWVPTLLHGLYNAPLFSARAASERAEAHALALWSLLLVPAVLVFAIVWAVRLSRRLRALQLEQQIQGALLEQASAPVVVITVAPTARPASPLWWLVLISGGLLVTLGFHFALGALLAHHSGELEAEALVFGLALLGAAPMGLGVRLFRLGIDRLNQRDHLDAGG